MKATTVAVAIAMAVVLVGVFATCSNGQSPECMDTFNQGCQDLNTIHGGQQCCSTVRSLYSNDLQCLCQIFTATRMTKQAAIGYLNICDITLSTGQSFPCDGAGEGTPTRVPPTPSSSSPKPPIVTSPPPPFSHPQAPPLSRPRPRPPQPRRPPLLSQDSGSPQAKENPFLGSFGLTGLYLLLWFAIV